MQITTANLQALRTTFSRVFQSAYDVAPNWWQEVASPMPSGSRLNTYGWMNALPNMREWVGERVVHNLAEVNYLLWNKEFELTYGLKRADFEDDANTLGIWKMAFEELGKKAKKHADVILASYLANGQNLASFDGQPFFSTTHPVNKYDDSLGQYSNYSASNMALTRPNYVTVRATMIGYKDAGGTRMGVRPDVLLVPPDLETAAKQIVEAELIANDAGTAAISNTLKGTTRVVVAEELADYPTTWYLCCTTKGVKPFIYQTRKAPEFVSRVALTDENVFSTNEFQFGSYVRDNVGGSLPFLCYKATA